MKELLTIDTSLIKILKQLRLKAGLKQVELAEKLGAVQSFVSKYESGERILSFSEVWQILYLFDIPPERIIELIKKELGR